MRRFRIVEPDEDRGPVVDNILVFIHTGGTPALFAYKEKLLEYIR